MHFTKIYLNKYTDIYQVQLTLIYYMCNISKLYQQLKELKTVLVYWKNLKERWQDFWIVCFKKNGQILLLQRHTSTHITQMKML